MRYFVYSPLEMDQLEAYEKAKPYLQLDSIVHVTHRTVFTNKLLFGVRPKALMDTYLVRVEADESLRVVDQLFS